MPQKMELSLEKRYEIVFLRLHPAGPKWSFEKIAKRVHCSKPTVIYWVNKYQENPDLSTAERPGRPRITTAKQDKRITAMAEKEHNITATQIQKKMEERNVEISARTVRRRLHEAGGKYTNEILKPLLTDDHQRKRLQWAKEHRNFDWNRVIFTDESTFQLYSSKKKVWQFARNKKVFRTVKHPPKIHVWGCFSASGFGKLVCFQRNLDANFMCSIYEQGLLASARELFGEGNIDWILQEDNDPKHRSKIAKKWKEENKVKVLPWPSMSPDQNPIENVWRLMKINIQKKKIKSVKGLKGELAKEWSRFSPELAEKLVDSMKRRVTALIDANGDYTMY
jgi:transposase